MAENPFFNLTKCRVDNWSEVLIPYDKFDVVVVPSGAAAKQILVSTQDGNVETAVPSSKDAGAGLGAWENFQDEDFDFSDIWTPSYDSGMTHEPKVVYTQFGDGYVQRQSDGLNHQRLVFDISFKDISDKEAKSVLAFFEYKGGVGKFKVTLPEPYGSQRLFVAKDWNHQFGGYDRNNITAKLIEVFDKSFTQDFDLT